MLAFHSIARTRAHRARFPIPVVSKTSLQPRAHLIPLHSRFTLLPSRFLPVSIPLPPRFHPGFYPQCHQPSSATPIHRPLYRFEGNFFPPRPLIRPHGRCCTEQSHQRPTKPIRNPSPVPKTPFLPPLRNWLFDETKPPNSNPPALFPSSPSLRACVPPCLPHRTPRIILPMAKSTPARF